MGNSLDPQRNAAGIVTSSWNHVIDDDGKSGRRERLIRIQLRHNQITGSRYVIVNGVIIPGSRGTTTTGSDRVQIDAYGQKMQIELLSTGLSWVYECALDGCIYKKLPEANDVTGDPMGRRLRAPLAVLCGCLLWFPRPRG